MSVRDLQALIAAGALNTRVSRADASGYVPFSRLIENEDVEQRLRQAVIAGERVALVGESGSGKTSIIQHVLRGRHDGFAPIWLAIGDEDPQTVLKPREFGQHLIQTIGRDTNEDRQTQQSPDFQRAVAATGREQTVTGAKVATKAGLSLRFPWLVTADLSRQIETVTASVTRSTSVAEVADGLRAILDLIKRDELTPVLIFDDTDSWLSRPYHPDPEPMIQAFFGQALPWLAKQCAPTSIVAVHTTYLDSDAYEEAEKNGDLQRRITVPHLTDVSQLHTIIDAHITASTLALDADEVFTADAVEELFRYYVHAARQSLRKVVVVAKLGLDAAEIAGAGVVDRSHVAPTVLEFS